MSASILKALGLSDVESGTYPGQWRMVGGRRYRHVIDVINPSTHETIGRVHASSECGLRNHRQTRARIVCRHGAATPAPKRGEAVRICGDALP